MLDDNHLHITSLHLLNILIPVSHFRMSVLRHDDDVPADIYNYQPGDINLDGSVNVLDVVGLVSQILGNYEEVEGDSTFSEKIWGKKTSSLEGSTF